MVAQQRRHHTCVVPAFYLGETLVTSAVCLSGLDEAADAMTIL